MSQARSSGNQNLNGSGSHDCPLCNMNADCEVPNHPYIYLKPFSTHLWTHHRDFFSERFSNDFLCGYCVCDGPITCSGRFPDFLSLVTHLWRHHSQGDGGERRWESHMCMPLHHLETLQTTASNLTSDHSS